MLEKLYATHQAVTFRAVETLSLPGYKGSTFRGALGHAIKKVACALPRKQCDTCLLRFRCAYSVCFETPVPEDAAMMRKYPFAPHPFVLEPPLDDKREYAPGEELTMGMCLVGRGNDYLAHFVYAFEELGRRGIGKGRGEAELVSITTRADGVTQFLYDADQESLLREAPTVRDSDIAARAETMKHKPLRLVFETPTRVKVEGSFTSDPRLGNLFPSLLRRLNSLHYFHCGGEPGKDVHSLLEGAWGVKTTQAEVRWIDWGRYSQRQDAKMQLGGFVGTVDYEPVPEKLLPFLLWGELLHLGKASAFGLGKYRIESNLRSHESDALGRRSCEPSGHFA